MTWTKPKGELSFGGKFRPSALTGASQVKHVEHRRRASPKPECLVTSYTYRRAFTENEKQRPLAPRIPKTSDLVKPSRVNGLAEAFAERFRETCEKRMISDTHHRRPFHNGISNIREMRGLGENWDVLCYQQIWG
jgi:hypothetical protein